MNDAIAFRHTRLGSGDRMLFLQEIGAGAPVLLLSGLGYASWCWEETMRLLASDFRLVALDNRGSGRSAKPAGPYSIESFADDAAWALDSLDIGCAHVVGSSMGGYIALMLVARHPKKVRSLLLSNTTQGGPGAAPLPAETAQAWAACAELDPRTFASRTMAFAYPPGWAEAHPERLPCSRLRSRPRVAET
jgi:3-oxoadipate enol-lactonase